MPTESNSKSSRPQTFEAVLNKLAFADLGLSSTSESTDGVKRAWSQCPICKSHDRDERNLSIYANGAAKPAISCKMGCDPVRIFEKLGFEIPTAASEKSKGGAPKTKTTTAFQRELGMFSLADLATTNADLKPRPVQWLLKDVVAAGNTTVICGESKAGKSTLVRKLVAHIIEHTDPFSADATLDGLRPPQGRVIWYTGEENLAEAYRAFDAAGVDRSRCTFFDDATMQWRPNTDKHEVLDDGSLVPIELSRYSEMLNIIDQAKRDGDPFHAIVLDTLPQVLGDINRGDYVDKSWRESILLLERRDLAVIGIMHPRKDNPPNAPIEASVKGSERMLSRPRLVFFARSTAAQDLLHYADKKAADGLGSKNPIRDRFNKTEPRPAESGRIGVLVPLKNSHAKDDSLKGWQYSMVNEGDVPVARFSTLPWVPTDVPPEFRDGKSFAEAVARKYLIEPPAKESEVEKGARVLNKEKSDERMTLHQVFREIYEAFPEGLASKEMQSEVEARGRRWPSRDAGTIARKYFDSGGKGSRFWTPLNAKQLPKV